MRLEIIIDKKHGIALETIEAFIDWTLRAKSFKNAI